MAILWPQTDDPAVISFDALIACDGQTDGQTPHP